MATATTDTIIENPSASGPVRAAFTTPTDGRISLSEAQDFDSLEDAAFSFHSFGSNKRLNDPDGAVGIVWVGEDHTDSQIELRFDANGSVFFEN